MMSTSLWRRVRRTWLTIVRPPLWCEATVGRSSKFSTLAEPFDVSLPAISKHLRVLERAGLVAQQKDGRSRRCRLEVGPMKQASDWIAQHARFWDQQLDALAEYLEDVTRD